MKHILSLFAFFLLLIVLLFSSMWISPVSVSAGTACLNAYVIQPGDTLSSIAQRFGVRVSVLAHLNRLANPHLIRVGQTLCLPEALPQPPTSTPVATDIPEVEPSPTLTTSPTATPVPIKPTAMSTLSLELVAEYTLSSTNPDVNVGPERVAGIRLLYPVTGTLVLTRPRDVSIASTRVSPTFWLVGNSEVKPVTFTLVVIGSPAPLLDLQLTAHITKTRTLTELFPSLPNESQITAALIARKCLSNTQPVTMLLNSQATDVVVRLELVEASGIFMPVQIDLIDYQTNRNMARLCHPRVFAALNTNQGTFPATYQLMVVAEVFKTGPAGGEGQRARCRRWRNGGRWSQFLYHLWC